MANNNKKGSILDDATLIDHINAFFKDAPNAVAKQLIMSLADWDIPERVLCERVADVLDFCQPFAAHRYRTTNVSLKARLQREQDAAEALVKPQVAKVIGRAPGETLPITEQRKKQLLEYLKAHPGARRAEIVTQLGWSNEIYAYILRQMGDEVPAELKHQYLTNDTIGDFAEKLKDYQKSHPNATNRDVIRDLKWGYSTLYRVKKLTGIILADGRRQAGPGFEGVQILDVRCKPRIVPDLGALHQEESFVYPPASEPNVQSADSVPATCVIMGPPGIGKSSLVAEIRRRGYTALDMEDVPSAVRLDVAKLIVSKGDSVIGAADLHIEDLASAGPVIPVLLYMKQAQYETRRAARDSRTPSKAKQASHSVMDWIARAMASTIPYVMVDASSPTVAQLADRVFGAITPVLAEVLGKKGGADVSH